MKKVIEFRKNPMIKTFAILSIIAVVAFALLSQDEIKSNESPGGFMGAISSNPPLIGENMYGMIGGFNTQPNIPFISTYQCQGIFCSECAP